MSDERAGQEPTGDKPAGDEPAGDASDIQYVDANGLRFAYLSQGEGPLALCVHGYPDTARTWERLLPDLAAAGYRAVAPWTRGYHPTSIPSDGDYGGLRLGEDVLALITALGYEDAVVIGHDWGALAVYTAANLEPERLSKMVTLAIPHPRILKPSPRILWSARHFGFYALPWIPESAIRADDFAHLRMIYKRWSPLWETTEEDLASVKQCFSQPGVVEAALGYYRCAMRRPLSADSQRLLKLGREHTSVAALVLAGAADGTLFPEAFEPSATAFTGPFQLKVIEGGGHFMHCEQPEAVSAAILEFLGPAAV